LAPVVGFDFDECLAQAYTLVPFVLLLERLLPRVLKRSDISPTTRSLIEKSTEAFYLRLALNEAETKGTLLRPSFLALLPRLLQLRQQGYIESLFMYSNNGISSVLNVVDHILALTLLQAPYNVPKDQLVVDSMNQLHCLSPRASLDDPCRASEPRDSNGFREKSFTGIQQCLGIQMSSDNLWYFDDTRLHTGLMNLLQKQYVVVKKYEVKLSNKKIAEFFIESFPLSAFNPGTKEANVLLSQIQVLFPAFRPTGKESTKSLAEKWIKELAKFSPLGAGRVLRNWNAGETAADLRALETSIQPIFQASQVTPNNETSSAFRIPIGGSKKTRRRNRYTRSKLDRLAF
jgi:hypothetical protein